MSVNRAWISGHESHTYIIAFGVNNNGDTVGSVIPARYLFTDGTLDYFEAGVSDDFIKFGIAPLSGSGNPFQLITLSVASHISPPSEPEPGSGTGGDSAGKGAGKASVSVQSTSNPPARLPEDPGTSAKLYTNANGVVSQATQLQSTDRRATVLIGIGVVAKDAGGKPLAAITLKALSPESLPAVPAGSAFTFAGMAYEFGPDGATFSPSIPLTFTLPQAQWGEDYSVKSYDPKSGTWQDLPATFDPTTGTATVQASHLCCFALFTKPLASPVTAAAATPTALPVNPQPPVSSPPTSALSIFMSMMGWVADLVSKNVIILVLLVLLLIAGFFIRQRKLSD
jgi:hypothetical protein